MNDEKKPRLIELFEKAKNVQKDLENTTLSPNSTEYQASKIVNEGIKLLEQCTEFINELQVFSKNETLEDISNESLQYLIIPALLGNLSLKLNSHSRDEILRTAKIYFRDFLQRLKSYEITDIELENDEDEEKTGKIVDSSLESMVRERNEKIARFKKEKELEEKLEHLEKMLENQTIDVEDSTVRELYLTQINRWVFTACDELNMISMEMNVLKNAPKDHQRVQEKQPKVPLKPFIITRNDLQKKVYGLGYPSIPTMTINEFITQKVDEGSLAINSAVYTNSLQQWADAPELKKDEDEKEAEMKEKTEEAEDVEALRKAREWDEWKDENRRGWGNRQNMS